MMPNAGRLWRSSRAARSRRSMGPAIHGVVRWRRIDLQRRCRSRRAQVRKTRSRAPSHGLRANRCRATGGRSAGHVHQVWASAPHDQRTTSAWIFGAICPAPGKAAGKGAGLVLPFCNTDAMNLHLAEIARTVAPGAHAVLLMDQAGWHMTDALIMPGNISIIPLPAKCPERWSGRKYLAVHAG